MTGSAPALSPGPLRGTALRDLVLGRLDELAAMAAQAGDAQLEQALSACRNQAASAAAPDDAKLALEPVWIDTPPRPRAVGP